VKQNKQNKLDKQAKKENLNIYGDTE